MRVGLFITCLADLFRPSVARAAVKLLEQGGAEVVVPVQSCCGQPAYNSGEKQKSVNLAQSVISAFEGFDYVVAPSGSCTAMIKLHYPGLFEEGSEWRKRSEDLSSRTFELSEFLVDVLKISLEFAEDELWQNKRIGYHDSCSGLRELGVRAQPRKLLKDANGINISELENSEICCGFGGTFCVKYPEISTKMVDNKIAGVEHANVDVVAGGDLGCLMNIAGRLKRNGKPTRVYHYAEILADEIHDVGVAGEPVKP